MHGDGNSQHFDKSLWLRMLHAAAHCWPDVVRHLHHRPTLQECRGVSAAAGSGHFTFLVLLHGGTWCSILILRPSYEKTTHISSGYFSLDNSPQTFPWTVHLPSIYPRQTVCLAADISVLDNLTGHCYLIPPDIYSTRFAFQPVVFHSLWAACHVFIFCSLFWVWLFVPVQWIAFKDQFLKQLIICQAGR